MTSHTVNVKLTVDEDIQAGYVNLCTCRPAVQKDYMDATASSIILDEAEDGHISGVEFLSIPTSEEAFLRDMTTAKIPHDQQMTVLDAVRASLW